jgi:hypothetical protein
MVEGFVCECQRRQLQCICRKEAAASIIARKSATSAVRLIHALHDRTEDPMSFFERLEARVKAVDSLLCVGLDPHAAQVRTTHFPLTSHSILTTSPLHTTHP